MAQYTEDWSGSTLGQPPTGWTARLAATAAYVVEEDVDGIDGRRMRMTISGGSQRNLLAWDALDSDPNRARLNLRVLVRYNSPTPSAANTYFGPAGRGAGVSAGTATLIGAILGNDAGATLRAQQYNSGTTTTLSTSSTGVWAPGNTYWIHLSVDGTAVSVTLAAAATPGTIIASATATTVVEAAGWVGLFGYFSGLSVDVLGVTAGTGGDPAPIPGGSPPASAPTIGTITPTSSGASVPFTSFPGDATILQYRLDGGAWTSAPGTSSPLTLTGLDPETEYEIELRGANGYGAGPASSPEVFETLPADASTPIAFSGTVANQNATVGTPFSLNLAPYFSGTETPFSYALNTGTLPDGLSLNSSTGVISGTPTTVGSASGLVVRGTDQDAATADTNAFSITVGASTGISVISLIDGGNVDPSLVTIDDPSSSSPVIYLDVRGELTAWTNFLFAVEGAAGKTPVFRFNRSTLQSGAGTPAAQWLPAYTTDTTDYKSWVRASSISLVGGAGGTIEWSFDAPLPAGRVYIASQPMGRQGDLEALVADLLTNHASVASPAPSANGAGVCATSPRELDGSGRQIGLHPMHAVKLQWPTSTTDGGPKRVAVMMLHIHSQGEALSWIAFRYWLEYVMLSPAAASIRANWVIYIYGALTPNGLYSGTRRANLRWSGDPNRQWAGSMLPEINAVKAAITSDLGLGTGGRFDVMLSWHGWPESTGKPLAWIPPQDGVPAEWTPPVLAYINALRTRFSSPAWVPSLSEHLTTDIWWSRDRGAQFAANVEVAQRGSTALSNYQEIAENWAKAMADVDAQGLFWEDDGSVTRGVRVQLHDGSTPLANLSGLTAVWWDEAAPHLFGAPTYATNSAATDGSGWLEVDIQSATGLGIGDPGFLLVYKAGASAPDDAVFSSRLSVVDIS